MFIILTIDRIWHSPTNNKTFHSDFSHVSKKKILHWTWKNHVYSIGNGTIVVIVIKKNAIQIFIIENHLAMCDAPLKFNSCVTYMDSDCTWKKKDKMKKNKYIKWTQIKYLKRKKKKQRDSVRKFNLKFRINSRLFSSFHFSFRSS